MTELEIENNDFGVLRTYKIRQINNWTIDEYAKGDEATAKITALIQWLEELIEWLEIAKNKGFK